MTDGDEPFKPVLLKAEVPKHVSEKLDELAKDMGFSTRAKLIRHIIDQYLNPQATFQEYERIDPGHGGREQARQDFDMSELTAVLHTLNKAMDSNAVKDNTIFRQNETIHRLVDLNENLQTQLVGNGPAALPEPSQVQPEQTQTGPEVAENRTEPEPVTQETGPTQTEIVPEVKHTETTQTPPQDKQPLQVGDDMLEVLQAVTLGNDMGVKFSKDTVRRAVTQGILMAVPDTHPLKVYSSDVRAFALEYKKIGKLPNMPQIRGGKVV
jgi:hypothetical protein